MLSCYLLLIPFRPPIKPHSLIQEPLTLTVSISPDEESWNYGHSHGCGLQWAPFWFEALIAAKSPGTLVIIDPQRRIHRMYSTRQLKQRTVHCSIIWLRRVSRRPIRTQENWTRLEPRNKVSTADYKMSISAPQKNPTRSQGRCCAGDVIWRSTINLHLNSFTRGGIWIRWIPSVTFLIESAIRHVSTQWPLVTAFFAIARNELVRLCFGGSFRSPRWPFPRGKYRRWATNTEFYSSTLECHLHKTDLTLFIFNWFYSDILCSLLLCCFHVIGYINELTGCR